MPEKIVVTGGSGWLGRQVIRELLDNGYDVLSLDRVAPQTNLCPSWIADLTHPGDVYQALNGAHGAIHLGAYQVPGLAPDTETFCNNVTAAYKLLHSPRCPEGTAFRQRRRVHNVPPRFGSISSVRQYSISMRLVRVV